MELAIYFLNRPMCLFDVDNGLALIVEERESHKDTLNYNMNIQIVVLL